jgi:hypothetical protein
MQIYSNSHSTYIGDQKIYSYVVTKYPSKDLIINYIGLPYKYTKYAKIKNKELEGKEYEIVIGECMTHKGIINNNDNIFPTENIPLCYITEHEIFIIIRNFQDVLVSNKNYIFSLTMDCQFSDDQPKVLNEGEVFEIGWNDNTLKIVYGMAGLTLIDHNLYNNNEYEKKLVCNEYDMVVLANSNNKYETHLISSTDDINDLELINKNENKQDVVYSINHLLLNFLKSENKQVDIVYNNRTIITEYTYSDGDSLFIHEHKLMGDGFSDIKINYDHYIYKIKCIHEKSDIDLLFKKKENAYVISFPDNFYAVKPFFSKIRIYSNNMEPVVMNYNIYVYREHGFRV